MSQNLTTQEHSEIMLQRCSVVVSSGSRRWVAIPRSKSGADLNLVLIQIYEKPMIQTNLHFPGASSCEAVRSINIKTRPTLDLI